MKGVFCFEGALRERGDWFPAGRIKAEDKILPRRVDLRLRRICDVWTDI
ncbi:hypothetical protein MCI89_21475 [Muricomes sp. OA1]|nr:MULTISPECIES: hypothetical protein [Clostridia]MCH1974920.1 hypothetical protein [Muricomes sp. OA1]GKH33748.1 hypothetical protein CE91St64_31550 [Faecalicatena contorta]